MYVRTYHGPNPWLLSPISISTTKLSTVTREMLKGKVVRMYCVTLLTTYIGRGYPGACILNVGSTVCVRMYVYVCMYVYRPMRGFSGMDM